MGSAAGGSAMGASAAVASPGRPSGRRRSLSSVARPAGSDSTGRSRTARRGIATHSQVYPGVTFGADGGGVDELLVQDDSFIERLVVCEGAYSQVVDCIRPPLQVEDRGSMSQSERDVERRTAPELGPGEYDLVEVAAAMRSLSQWVAGGDGDRAARRLGWRGGRAGAGGALGQRQHAAFGALHDGGVDDAVRWMASSRSGTTGQPSLQRSCSGRLGPAGRGRPGTGVTVQVAN